MLLVVAIHLQQHSQNNMAIDKNNYHITLKNLRTWVTEGFMLAWGDTPYVVQGVDNIAQRIQDWEILYSDFTNSRVFAQENWSEGISKYWDPEKNGYYIFPSKKYKDKKNVLIDGSEFTLGGKVEAKFDLPFTLWEWPMCRGETAWYVYAGAGMIIYRSTDYGLTWSVWKDFAWELALSDVDEITDIKYQDTESFTITHSAPLGTMTVPNIQQLFVCFYNRTTKASGIARYEIASSQRPASGSTYLGSGSSVAAAYGTTVPSVNVNTSGIATTSFQAYKVNNSQGLTIPGTWWSLGLFPWQVFKARRNDTGVVYTFTVWFAGGAFGGTNEIWVPWVPSYSASPDSLNFYTIYDIGKNTANICLPTSDGISSFIWAGRGLWQNVKYNGILYTIYGLGNGLTWYGNIPSYTSGAASGSFEYIMLRRVDGTEAWSGIFWNGNQLLTTEKWIYKTGVYANSITKFVQVTGQREHLWWFNHIDPINKLYDPGYWEIATSASNSNIYAASFSGVLHSAQNHTATFNDGDCPISGAAAWTFTSIMYIGTQYGSSENGTESKLLRYSLLNAQTAPEYSIAWVVGENGITSMHYFGSLLYMGTKKEWYAYEYNNTTGILTQLAKLPTNPTTGRAIIDAMTSYAWKIVCSNQAWSWVYNIDPNTRQTQAPLIETDVLCGIDGLDNSRIYNICNTGGSLLFSDWLKIYFYDPEAVSETGYLESSIYGGYISNVDKLWIYAYVRVKKWIVDDDQSVALEVSLDEWDTWNFCPTKPGWPFSPTNTWTPETSIDFGNASDKQQLVFFFPHNTRSGTILYRCWLKKWNTVVPVVNHIGVHFNLNYRQELLFNYQVDLNKSFELLNGRGAEKDKHISKLIFLKDIWQNQDMIELVDVTWKKYTCIPFSDDRTPWQGLVISTSNSNGAVKDLDNLTFKVALWLKTIANYEKVI